jgi:hypothetical protein
MSSNNLSHEQLAMFMTPREINSRYRPNPYDFDEHEEIPAEVMHRKLHESKKMTTDGDHSRLPDTRFVKDSLYTSIKREGVKQPVELNPHLNDIIDGHHRIAAAMHHAPDDYIPVTYGRDD